jgi:hypothetical protein
MNAAQCLQARTQRSTYGAVPAGFFRARGLPAANGGRPGFLQLRLRVRPLAGRCRQAEDPGLRSYHFALPRSMRYDEACNSGAAVAPVMERRTEAVDAPAGFRGDGGTRVG